MTFRAAIFALLSLFISPAFGQTEIISPAFGQTEIISPAFGQTETAPILDQVDVVTLAALDKITTQLSTIEIRQNETVHFGTLEITLRYCRTNPPEEKPETSAFLEITDVGHNNQSKKVFSGWMFASSPALSPLEHPVYDVWVKDCKMVSGPASLSRE